MRGLSLPLCAALARGATLRPAFAPVCRAGPLRGVVSPAEPPRLMLMSSGLTTPELEATFRGMLHEAGAGADPCITMVVTGQEEIETLTLTFTLTRSLTQTPTLTRTLTGQMTPSNEAGPPDGASGRKPKSAGEKRRRRWYEARKKGRLLGAQLGVEVRCVDCAQTQGAELERELEGARCIWVTGGNTFFLLQHMRSSGAHSQ